MKITDDYGKNPEKFEKVNIDYPKGFDFDLVKEATEKEPIWVHFGGGNLFRCMQAAQQQTLLEKGLSDKGIILAETWDDELIEKVYDKFNNRTLNVILAGDGSYSLKLVDSVTSAHYVNAIDDKTGGFSRMKEIFASSSLQLITLTVTEKGYNIKDLNGNYFEPVAKEIENGPEKPISLMGILASLLLSRFKNGGWPLAMVSTDNFSHNGDKLKSSIVEIVSAWEEKGFVTSDFTKWLNDSSKVSFPFSMIDRITPTPSDIIAEKLKNAGIEGTEIVKTEKFTTSASFVNTEETNYLVIEDSFPNGRPKLEEAGVIFVSREKVDEVERMKVCTCLNPLHTSLAVVGCLLGFTKISDEVRDANLLALIQKIGYDEGLPVVTDPGIISPKQFIDEVIEKRLPNPFIPDSPQRIATDTSQKLPIRFGVTISLYDQSLNLDVRDLRAISFTLAAWLRYLLAVDDEGNKFDRSPDPMLVELDPIFEGLKLGSSEAELEKVRPLLSDSNIFGVDLVKVGLADGIFKMFTQMCQEKGAVRKLLEQIAA